jgi:hypothetical protein
MTGRDGTRVSPDRDWAEAPTHLTGNHGVREDGGNDELTQLGGRSDGYNLAEPFSVAPWRERKHGGSACFGVC